MREGSCPTTPLPAALGDVAGAGDWISRVSACVCEGERFPLGGGFPPALPPLSAEPAV